MANKKDNFEGTKKNKATVSKSKNVKEVKGKLKAYSDEELHKHEMNRLKKKNKRGNSRKRTIKMDVHPNAPKFSSNSKQKKHKTPADRIKDLQKDNSHLTREVEKLSVECGDLKIQLSNSSENDEIDLLKQCLQALLEGLEFEVPENIYETIGPEEFFLIGNIIADKNSDIANELRKVTHDINMIKLAPQRRVSVVK